MRKISLLSIVLFQLIACNQENLNNNLLNDNIQINNSTVKSKKIFSKVNNISEYFPKLNNSYKMYYTLFRDRYKCSENTSICAKSVISGYSSNKTILKILDISNNNISALINLEDDSGIFYGTKKINESESKFWQTLSESFIKFHLGQTQGNYSIEWSVSDSDDIIEIKNNFNSIYPEKYKIREIRAKITGINEEAIFKVSKEFGIIEFKFEDTAINEASKLYTTTIIGKYVEHNPNDGNHPIIEPSSDPGSIIPVNPPKY